VEDVVRPCRRAFLLHQSTQVERRDIVARATDACAVGVEEIILAQGRSDARSS
jgi:hypothetical protein